MDYLSWLFYSLIVISTLALHELGHWAQMRRLGLRVERITLGMGPAIRIVGKYHLGAFPIGACVTPDPQQWHSTSAYNRFMVAIAGPLASFSAGVMMLAFSLLYPATLRGLSAFAALHFMLGMVNLLPVPPLDGWVALIELCNMRKRPLSPKMQTLAGRLGNGLVYGVGFWYIGKILTGEI